MLHNTIIKELFGLKLKLVETVTGWLPEPLKAQLREIRLDILKTVNEVTAEYLGKQTTGEKTGGSGPCGLKKVDIE